MEAGKGTFVSKGSSADTAKGFATGTPLVYYGAAILL